MTSQKGLESEILEYIGSKEGRDVPLYELILRFRSSPYRFSKEEVISVLRGLEDSRLVKSYLPVKCRLIPAYRLKDVRTCP